MWVKYERSCARIKRSGERDSEQSEMRSKSKAISKSKACSKSRVRSKSKVRSKSRVHQGKAEDRCVTRVNFLSLNTL